MRHPLSHVVIVRVEGNLRAALAREAAGAGVSLSEIARRRLRLLPEDRDPPPSAPAAMPPRLAA